ncbi:MULTISPECIES: hypothetical protein [Nostoc]|uniref:Uncharacterized protein n=1 Tax=Nostoc paludosum FACHB-159 TaxID=2692908 RepID=A0ABR8KMC7_9NOSO|nr:MULTISPECIES: hypothetical protein [Nostoc]MBD2683551.1 hypothetical protein [Nostoc sp. FACHB-857]MBD2739756.1 hypothetical protein [Nostoc paludosum FACHB-159]
MNPNSTKTNKPEMISIKESAERLGVAEEIIRFSLTEAYPDDFDSLKEITLAEFETLANTFKQKALEQNTGEVAAIAPNGDSPLPIEQQQQIIDGTVNALQEFAGNYVLTIEKIASTLAYLSGQAVVDNFVEIHSNTVRDGLESYLDQFAAEFVTAAHSIKGVNAKDFLSQRGITQKQRTAQKSLQEILHLAANP